VFVEPAGQKAPALQFRHVAFEVALIVAE